MSDKEKKCTCGCDEHGCDCENEVCECEDEIVELTTEDGKKLKFYFVFSFDGKFCFLVYDTYCRLSSDG